MKNILSTAVLAAALFLATSLTSCLKVQETDYIFNKISYSNIMENSKEGEETQDSLRVVALNNIVLEVPYFSTTSSYYGTYNDACEQATLEFYEACQKIDKERIVALLKKEDTYMVAIQSATSGDFIAYVSWKYEEPESKAGTTELPDLH